MDPITIAAVSCMIFTKDPSLNMERIEHWSRRAAQAGAELVLFNETSLTGYWQTTEIRQLAQPADGPAVQELIALARELQIIICFGLAEQDGEKVYNSQLLVGPEGLMGVHRKSQLAGGADGEAKYFDQGEDVDVFEVGSWRIGIAICFESVQPEVCRALAAKGADFILAPYMNGVTARDIEDGKRPYFQQRALENDLWYIAVDQCGVDHRTGELTRPGAACFVDPMGRIVAMTSLEETGEHMVLYRLDPADVERDFGVGGVR